MMSNQRQLDLSRSDKSEIFKCPYHADNISKKLQSFYEKKEFFDIVLIAGVVRVPAHRIVLSASSDYFLAMFRSVMQEAKADEVELREIDGSTMKMLIDYMYTASIELYCETVENVLRAADFLQMNILVAACCDFMGEQLDTGNCLGITLFAEQHNYTPLHKKALSYTLRHFDKVWTEKEFVQLDDEQINKFFSSNDFFPHSQEMVFLSLVAWVEHDKESREKLILSLLSYVRFTLLKPKFIIENRHSVCKTIECYEFICSWLQWHLSPESRSQFPKERTKVRKSDSKLAFASGLSTNDLKIQTFNPDMNTWSYEEFPIPSKKRTQYRAIVVNNKFIIAGGMIDDVEANSVECLDLQTKQWTDLPPMGLGRRHPGIAELNGDLYVVGGKTAAGWLCSVEKYDFSTREWQFLTPLSSPLVWIKLAVHKGYLYAIGNNCHVMERYDSAENKWTQKAFIYPKMLDVGMATFGGNLYAVGGSNNRRRSNSIERYCSSTDTWEVVGSLKAAQSSVRCCAWNDRLIACGGYRGDWTDSVEEYDSENNDWNTLAPLLPVSSRSESDFLFTV